MFYFKFSLVILFVLIEGSIIYFDGLVFENLLSFVRRIIQNRSSNELILFRFFTNTIMDHFIKKEIKVYENTIIILQDSIVVIGGPVKNPRINIKFTVKLTGFVRNYFENGKIYKKCLIQNIYFDAKTSRFIIMDNCLYEIYHFFIIDQTLYIFGYQLKFLFTNAYSTRRNNPGAFKFDPKELVNKPLYVILAKDPKPYILDNIEDYIDSDDSVNDEINEIYYTDPYYKLILKE